VGDSHEKKGVGTGARQERLVEKRRHRGGKKRWNDTIIDTGGSRPQTMQTSKPRAGKNGLKEGLNKKKKV